MSLIPSWFGGRRSNVFDPFSLDLWDPFKGFPFPSSSLSASNFAQPFRENAAFMNTRIDWKENPEAHVFKADLLGLKKEEIKVEIEDDRVLQISGERNVEKEDKNDMWHRMERSSGKFRPSPRRPRSRPRPPRRPLRLQRRPPQPLPRLRPAPPLLPRRLCLPPQRLRLRDLPRRSWSHWPWRPLLRIVGPCAAGSASLFLGETAASPQPRPT